MWRTLLAAAVGLAIGHGGVAHGMGGNLDRPSIAIPVDPKTRETDRVAQKIAEVLQAHHKEFTGGSFLNAHSVLYFGGATAGVNALLDDLAKVEGATIRVRFSKAAGVTRWMFPGEDTPADRPCDCEVDHLGWGAARTLTVTVYLGGGRIDLDALNLPPIMGQPGGSQGR
jgi:hypothetical protein